MRSTTTPGEITIKASLLNEGANTPAMGELSFQSLPANSNMLFIEEPDPSTTTISFETGNQSNEDLQRKVLELERELNEYKLKEVEEQQRDFEGKEE